MSEDLENLSFDRKYRPIKLIDYIGNDKVKRTVLRNLNTERKPQAILLYGNSGCGKTSLARLLAKEYSCENRDAETGACCECSNCKQIDKYITFGNEGDLLNIQEIDVTEQSGKNDLASVFEDMMIPAFGSEYKVYIFDEVHKASTAAQNRLLKITEEPPAQVLIIFCTTEPEKLLEPLKNRCGLQLHITKPQLSELTDLLKKVCIKEEVDYDRKGLEFIATRSELTIRTSLKNLQQVITEVNNATYKGVLDVFQEVSDTVIIDFFRALRTNNILKYVVTLHQIKTKMDLVLFVDLLKDFIKRGIYIINGLPIEGVGKDEIPIYKELFTDLGVDNISFLLEKILHLDRNNLELELLFLVYSGFGVKHEDVINPSKIAEELAKTVTNEIELEQGMAHTVLKEQEKEDLTKAINNAEDLMQGVDIDMLLDMGASLVENK